MQTKREMQKGSKQWYDHMAKELKHHVVGMKYLNAVPKVKKAIAITQAAKSIAEKYSTSATSEDFKEIERLIKQVQDLMMEQTVMHCSKYLGVKYFYSPYTRPLGQQLLEDFDSKKWNESAGYCPGGPVGCPTKKEFVFTHSNLYDKFWEAEKKRGLEVDNERIIFQLNDLKGVNLIPYSKS